MQAPLSLFEQYAAGQPEYDDEAVVRAICERLLDEGEAEPPVDVELIASLCGISRIEYRSEGPAGMLVHKDGSWIASVSLSDGFERQRFTILHEGGHTFLPDFKRGTDYHRCKGPRTREEQLCDLAAAELLLPRRHFVGDVVDAGTHLDGVEALAGMYQASLQATARRVVDLAPGRTGLMVFQHAHKPGDAGREDVRPPKVRLEYGYSAGWLPFPLRHKSAPDGSVVQRAWQGEQIDEEADVSDFFAEQVGQVAVSARRYGDRVLAMVSPST